MTKPRIGLTLSTPKPLNAVSHQRYREALERAGADVVALHPGDELPDDLDGLMHFRAYAAGKGRNLDGTAFRRSS